MDYEKDDAHLMDVFLRPVRRCALYKPAFGQGNSGGLSLQDFQVLYGGDQFYKWLGLDDPMVYAAHKAAGGLTSVYRQIGIGSERLFREILKLTLNLSKEQLDWSYKFSKPDGKNGIHTLDACIKLADLEPEDSKRLEDWLSNAVATIGQSSSGIGYLNGAVFEVRQGYKSADSKRQNADLRYGVRAYQSGLLPCFAIMSSQVSEPVIRRYRNDGMLVLTGTLEEDPTVSTFSFLKQVIGYDLVRFFTQNNERLKAEINSVIQKLLTP